MRIPSFKKNEKVRYIVAGSDFIDPPTQNILWKYGKILFKIKSKHGTESYFIENFEDKTKAKISKYLVFKVN
tara:strand:+ start:5990 stop:6205 length:216 start_codon:yes stop_codon:yes gene_type:complete